MQNPQLKFRQSSISEKTWLFLWKIKTSDEITTIEFHIFFRNIAHISSLAVSAKRCLGLSHFVWILSYQ